jgi:putative endonuclease
MRPDAAARAARRSARERHGRRAEALAAWWLRLKGWRIVARRFATPVGELDLVARRGHMLAFVEVKARRVAADALVAVTPQQQGRLVRAAEWFLAGRPELARLDCRFDVIAVVPWRLPRHLADMFRPDPKVSGRGGW